MTDEHIRHLNSILSRFNQKATSKYKLGQIEHGGELWTKSNIIDMAIDEAIDQVIYLYTLKDQLEINKPADIEKAAPSHQGCFYPDYI